MDKKKQITTIIANNLKALLNKQSLSYADLSQKSGISTGTISKIVNGKMSINVPMLMALAEGLDVPVQTVLGSLAEYSLDRKPLKEKTDPSDLLFVGILSINHRRLTCVKNHVGDIIGTSALNGDLDLAETIPSVFQLIEESIKVALSNSKVKQLNLKNIDITIVVQSYEFEETRSKFIDYISKYFNSVIVLSDWQITYLATFGKNLGISLVTDKGISVSYMHDGELRKLGGWKYPVYDLGGENWLGIMAIRHTIDAYEQYIPMDELAQNILAKFNGKVEKITETCGKSPRDPDIYCLFADILLRAYFTKNTVAKNIIEKGFKLIYRAIEKIDSISGKQYKIAINGSLADVYNPFIKVDRLIPSPSSDKKIELLADLARDPKVLGCLNRSENNNCHDKQ